MTDLYQEVILEEYKHPQHRGQILDADLILDDQHLSCGDMVKIYLKLDSKKEKIIDIKWEGKGCAISMAAMSILAAEVFQKQLSFPEIKKITQVEMESFFGLANIAEGRVGCLMLGLQTLQKT
jgi:nitrogen fixation protein NifU and related proteins